MTVWGKIIGGAAGFVFGGPLGALLGIIAGHAVDSLSSTYLSSASHGDATKSITFTIGTIALSAKMAKVDGAVTSDEVTAFREVFHIPPEEERNVTRVFDLARKTSHGFESYARQIAKLLEGETALLERLLDGLFHIARADGHFHADEISYLHEVARIFGFSDEDFRRIRAGNGALDHNDPYLVLGVPSTVNDQELKQAYRKLAHALHPDRAIAAGLPPECVALTNGKLAVINAAYQRIQHERRLVEAK